MIYNDHEIVRALLSRDETVTRDFFYRKCYPLFKSIFDNYHTDCSSCMEFISEIYIHILTPNKETGMCKLDSFRFQSTLFTLLKTVCLFYCYKHYERVNKTPMQRFSDKYDEEGVRIDTVSGSINLDNESMVGYDVEVILNLMPNRRYSRLIRLRYLEGHTNE